MKKFFFWTCFLSAVVGHAQVKSIQENRLKIDQIKPNVYLHISYLQTKVWGKVACNGLVYVQGNEAFVFDTPIDDAASEILYESFAKENINVVGVVVNHFHDDCLGGLKFFHTKGIKSYSSKLTQKFARKDSLEVPTIGFKKELKLKLGTKTITNAYLGAAHTRDNIVSYLDDEKVLFGGCMVKALKAGKGNLADADTTAWSATIEKVKKRFPQVEVVIPGHDKPSGQDLLNYTIRMFSEGK